METGEFQKLWKTFEIIAIGFVLLGILLVLYLIRGLLAPFIIAFVITFCLSPVVDYMEGEGINRTLAVIFLILVTLIILLILWRLTWPTLQTEIGSFQKNAPHYARKIQDGLNQGMKLLEKKAGFIPEGVLQGALQKRIDQLTSGTGDISFLMKTVGHLLFTLLLIPVIVFFFLKDGRRMKKVLITYVPNKYFETFLTLFHEIGRQISGYIRGQLMDSLCVGVLAIIGLYCFGINYAILIGAVVGLVNIVPYIGPFLGLTFGALLALMDTGSIVDVLQVAGVIALVKALDDTALSPLIVSRSVQVHPLMVIVLIAFGGTIHGIWGMLLAVPLYCTMRVSFRILYKGFVEYGNW
ncbi:MAG: AI-2E family transporter [Thermodesulfobacteriota bacterium]